VVEGNEVADVRLLEFLCGFDDGEEICEAVLILVCWRRKIADLKSRR
jgi:hypothetical protein